ncbi:MAG: hypothetical protein RIS94_1463 [Pseudomonadota bacterium]|jgi:methyl-accepting chemotaxis protein
MHPPLTSFRARSILRWAPAGIALSATVALAWACGGLLIASLIVMGHAAALAALRGGMSGAATGSPIREDVDAGAGAGVGTGVGSAQPAGLAFLSDPFAIPPPVMADMHAVQPFVETLCGQIDGIQHEVADGVVTVVEQVRAINVMSTGQRQRIHASLAGADAIRAASAVPGEIVGRLEAMLAERDRVIEQNFAGLQALVDEFQDLRNTVDVISRIADKAYFLSVNASIEAHHQSAAGAAFGLIATEMRSLAGQTASGAREVGQSINAFSERMHQQLAAAMPESGDGATELGALFRELDASQATISAAGDDLDGVIQTLDAGHQEIVRSLSEILGSLQFQDVMRQRLEQIFRALRDLEDLATRSITGAPPERSLLDVLEDQRRDYVMESQRHVHSAVVANENDAHEPVARIELF